MSEVGVTRLGNNLLENVLELGCFVLTFSLSLTLVMGWISTDQCLCLSLQRAIQ